MAGPLPLLELLPAIDLRDGKCVRLRQGDYSQETVFADDPIDVAQRWERQGANWLHLVDLDGAKAGRPVNLDAIQSIIRAVTIPCQLGGGIRDESTIKRMLEEIGLARVIVGTKALKERAWFEKMTQRFSGQLMLGIDARDSLVATEGWLETSETSALDLAKIYADLPIAAIIYTNIANDGMLRGIDEGTLRDLGLLADFGVPVIASGGVTTLDDIRHLLDVRKSHPLLSGAIIGRALYERTLSLPDALQLVQAGADQGASQ